MTTHFHIRRAIAALQRGGVIAYPTETVYGLGCDPLCHDALTRILAIKRRPWQKGFIIIAASYAQLAPYILPLDEPLLAQIQATWPGPVTWLLPARPECSPLLRGTHDTLAARVSSHPVARSLCQRFGGAIVSTSANLSGQPPARNFLSVMKRFHNAVDYIVPGASNPGAKPSEIRDAKSSRIVRPG